MTEIYFVVRTIPYEGQIVSEFETAKDAYDYLQTIDSDDSAYVIHGEHVRLLPAVMVKVEKYHSLSGKAKDNE